MTRKFRRTLFVDKYKGKTRLEWWKRNFFTFCEERRNFVWPVRKIFISGLPIGKSHSPEFQIPRTIPNNYQLLSRLRNVVVRIYFMILQRERLSFRNQRKTECIDWKGQKRLESDWVRLTSEYSTGKNRWKARIIYSCLSFYYSNAIRAPIYTN